MGDDTIRKITPNGAVTTLAGMATQSGSANGGGLAARFDAPSGIAVDGAGNVYVADKENNAIRKGNLATVPVITSQPVSQLIETGGTVVFNVSASGAEQPSTPAGPAGSTPSVSYQWQFNGADLSDGNGISGSNGPQLVILGAGAANDGNYGCVVSASGVSIPSGIAGLLVLSVPIPGGIPNFSARGFVGTGGNILILGFYVSGTTSRTALVEALGPALGSLGVPGVLQHPALTIHDSTGATICSNTGWGSSRILAGAGVAVGANPALQPNSADSELLVTLPPGSYTAEINGADGGTGVSLCAIYELP
jgi:hypothetical protein